MILAWLLALAAWAVPVRGPVPRPERVRWEPGRQPDLLVVKLVEGRGLRWEDGRVVGPGQVDLDRLNALLAGARPWFTRDPEAIRRDREAFDPEHRLASLDLYLAVRSPDAEALGDALLAEPLVETAFLALAPVAPPGDIPPETPDFTDQQLWWGASPDGLGFDAARAWPGGTGANVAIADVEYDWEEEHEDLDAAVGAAAWGWRSGLYAFHGTSVLGMLVAGDNGYGVVGGVPDAEVLVASPFDDDGIYAVAAAIDGAAALLDAGDVLLIEQQALVDATYAPVEVSQDVFDAIAAAVARGIVVVEPAGNGHADLDGAEWDGIFDRDLRDSGAIMVGGGTTPLDGQSPREWYLFGSGYGSRVDVQGWWDGIVTTTSGEEGETRADLFLPDGDGRQGYTSDFGGTSGASAMVAAAAAAAQSIAWEVWGAPWDPVDLRAALVSTGTPEAPGSQGHIGPLPDLRRLLRTWMVR